MLGAKAIRGVVVVWLCIAAGQALAQGCKSPPEANNDKLPWTGIAERLEVRANDYDPAGRTFTIASITSVTGGTAVPCCDGEAVYFVPADGATEGSFQYTIVNSDGQTDSAIAGLGKDEIPLPPPPTVTFTYSCDGLYCSFRSQPSTFVDLRAYSWEFYKITRDSTGKIISSARDPEQCQKSEWLGQSFSCTFPSQGERAVTHRALYHGGEVAVTNPTPQYVTITSQRPEIRLSLSAPRSSLYVEARMTTDLTNPTTHYYTVDWGDGQIDSPTFEQITGRQVMTHTYATEGTQKVAIVHQQSGTRHWEAINVANKAPAPRISASAYGQETWQFTIPFTGTDPTNGIDEFDVRSVPGPYGWEWPANAPKKWELDFGDGNVTQFNPTVMLDGSMQVSHDYPSRRGLYKARLLVTDHLGATGTVEQEINITNARPVASLAYFCDNGYCRFDASKSTDETVITKYRFNIFQLSNEGYWTSWKSVEQSAPVYDVPLLALGKFKVELTVVDDQLAQDTAVTFGTGATNTETPWVFYAIEPCSLGASQWFNSGAEIWFTGKPVCGIPNDADVVAAAVNVRLYTPTHPGNLSRNTADVPVWMNISPARPAQSNLIIVPYYAGTTALLANLRQYSSDGTAAKALAGMEVFGYFRRVRATLPLLETANAVGPLWFRPVQPCALLDTRKEPPALSTTPRVADFRNRCGVTSDMAALAMQMAVIGPSVNSSAVAFSSASPLPSGRASIEALAGRNLSNMVFSKVSNGLMKLATSSGTANAALTMSGAFVRDRNADRFYAITPCRVFDSRAEGGAPLAAGKMHRMSIGGNCGVSRYASAVLLHVAVVSPNGQGNLQLYASDTDLPDSYAVTNFLSGETIGSSVIVPLRGGRDLSALLTMFNGNSAHVIVDVHGYFDGRRNVAAAANGGKALASDPTNPNFPPAAMIDGDRTGAGWGTGTGGWSDSSPTISTDFVGIEFAQPARIDQVDLFTLPDNYTNTYDPTRSEFFTKWGVTSFDVGYWDDALGRYVYFQVPNNNLRWARVIFPSPVVTSKLSIVVRSGCPKCGTPESDNLGGSSRIVEIEAWEVPAGTP